MDFVVIDIEEDKQVQLLLGRPFLTTGASFINVKKGELTPRVGDEVVHFNLKNNLKQSELINVECEIVETKIPITSELINDCNFQSSMNENEMNFQYLEHLEVEFLNSNFKLKEAILNVEEISIEKSSSYEEKSIKVNISSEGLILKEMTEYLKYAFLHQKKKSQPSF